MKESDIPRFNHKLKTMYVDARELRRRNLNSRIANTDAIDALLDQQIEMIVTFQELIKVLGNVK